jgi:hypothetical protein
MRCADPTGSSKSSKSSVKAVRSKPARGRVVVDGFGHRRIGHAGVGGRVRDQVRWRIRDVVGSRLARAATTATPDAGSWQSHPPSI